MTWFFYAARSTHSSESKLYPVCGGYIIEVLSIFIDSKANESPSVCGWVRVDHDHKLCVFDRDMSDPEFCTPFIDMTIFIDDHIRSSANIYGCVFARYGSHNYSSVYDKKYYQTRLFDKPQADPVELTTQSSSTSLSKLPLSKSALSMPVDDSLIVEANLWVANPNQEDVAVCGTVEFEADNKYRSCIVHKEIHGQRYRIQISVKFDD